jgi:D-alanine-D-alanine ligase
MRTCVLQPSYRSSACDYQHYDPPRDLSPLLPEYVFHHEFLHKVSSFGQIRALQRQGFDIYVNLCEGYRDSDEPSIDVIHALEDMNLPFTGPTSALYDPPKDVMTLVARASGVAVPAYAVVDRPEGIAAAVAHLRYPLFVKPAAYGDSMGVDERSLVTDRASLRQQATARIHDYGRVLIEEYVDGAEFTVLVAAQADPAQAPLVLVPIEFRFPEGDRFKTYALKVTAFHPECNVPCADPDLDARLRAAAAAVFTGFSGKGYARLDFRVAADGTIFFLEVNFTCSVFYPDGYQGSADYVLQHDGLGQAEVPAAHHRRRPGTPRQAAEALRGEAVRSERRAGCQARACRGRRRLRGRGACPADRHPRPRRAHLEPGRPRAVPSLRVPDRAGCLRPLGRGPRRLGAAESLLRSQHGVSRPQPGSLS